MTAPNSIVYHKNPLISVMLTKAAILPRKEWHKQRNAQKIGSEDGSLQRLWERVILSICLKKSVEGYGKAEPPKEVMTSDLMINLDISFSCLRTSSWKLHASSWDQTLIHLIPLFA
ncbi:Proenkephalin-B [Manis pentadactyla]|nr:Proenkephalin-B [Manis pentadactyla]